MRPTLRRAAVAAIAVTSLSGAAVLTNVGGAEASTWSSTVTKGVRLTGTRLGATAPDQTLHLTLSLEPRNAAAQQAAVKAMYTPGSSTYHHYLTAAQWRARYAPSSASVAKVTAYLKSQGMTGIEVAENRLEVTATASAAQAEKAFHTSLVSYLSQGKRVYANTSAAEVPTALHPLVVAVMGLNDVPLDAIKTQVVHPAKTSASPQAGGASTAGQFPAGFRTTYDANGTTSGAQTKIAILTEGAVPPVIASLRYAEKEEHAAQVPVTVVPSGAQSPDTSGADEFDMDTQASSIMATKVKRMYLYSIGALTDAQLDFGFDKFIGQNVASAMSASIGGCEYNSFLDGSELSLDISMQEASLQGQSLFASSGDEGDACAMVANTGTPAGVPQDEWPAVGAFDLAVGGTSLVSDAKGNRIQELAWLGGGGGDSTWENPQYWEQRTNPGYDSEFASGGRAVPDVALDADPNAATPVKVYVGHTVSYVGGTSLSSPLMLGVWARLESAHQNALGLAPPALYAVYDKVNPGTIVVEQGIPVNVPATNPKPVKGFTDIVLGANGAYAAKPGWDYATGLGAPDVKQLIKTIAPTIRTAVKPGFQVAARIASSKGHNHMLAVTVKITHTTKAHPATGKVHVLVVNGRSCTAKVTKSVGTCQVLTTKTKRHTLKISYSGDKRYAAATATRNITTK